ncbi:hypothetical protein GOP47_0009363 [Adiantum capillus-veneris]|uniref:3'(2'),5'-bisphosphate nucleotidase n=1 Tax=Adiantum capillus-veneris TaxID=13818 RepID=A0A9D4UWY6_ADICA|nr:hypothetical protein GOP47_0009363 [Adiantum capillus-veneris]
MGILAADAMAPSLLPSRLRRPQSPKTRIVVSFLPAEGAIYRRELEAALNVVERASLLCSSVRSSMFMRGDELVKKSDLSPVTVADFGVQSLISMELGSLFPSIPLVAEEDASLLRLELEERGNEGADKPSLVSKVVEAVSRVASPGVQPVSIKSVLEAIDRSGEVYPFPSTRKMSSFWVLDPIDGTRGFVEGGDSLYVIGLSLVVDGKVVLGVMGCPCLTRANMASSVSGKRLIWTVEKMMKENIWSSNGVLVTAYRGHGTWLRSLDTLAIHQHKSLDEQDFVQSFVDGCITPDDAHFGLSRHENWASTPLATLVPAKIDSVAFHFCCGSLCKYFAVAIGAVSAVLLPQSQKFVKAWDHAAGLICVQEAGGKVTDGEGSNLENLIGEGQRTFVPGGGSIMVTNGHLHHIILEHLSR